MWDPETNHTGQLGFWIDPSFIPGLFAWRFFGERRPVAWMGDFNLVIPHVSPSLF
jgi:hypothetical protein